MKEKATVARKVAQIGLWVVIAVVMFAFLLVSAQFASSSVRAESITEIEEQLENGRMEDLLDEGGFFDETKEKSVISKDEESQEVTVLFEDTIRRTANEKHFKLSDGSYVASIFSYDVHYLEGDRYEEIDNRLIEDKDGKFKNQKNVLKVELPQSYDDGAKSSVSAGGYSLSFSLLNQVTSKSKLATIKNVADSKTVKATKEFKYEMNTQSAMRYYFADSRIELEHNLVGTSLKENIIVNKPLDSYVFEYAIEAKDLKLVLTEAGDVEAIDESGKSIFTIPKGYMFDSADAVSEDIKYELEEKDGQYLLRVIPDVGWLNEEKRVFPITIDPTVTLSGGSQFISASTEEISNGILPISTTSFSAIDFNLTESLDRAIILSAEMYLYINANNSTARLQVWENVSEFRDNESLVSTPLLDLQVDPNDPSIVRDIYSNYYFDPNNTIEPYDKKEIASTSFNLYSFDITESVKNVVDFEDYEEFYGFAFNTEYGSAFILNEDFSDVNGRPIVYIIYRNMVGLEDYWDYDTYSIGNNTIYINTYNDEATLAHSDAAIDVDTTIVLQHVYMDRYSDANYNIDGVFSDFKLGFGWKLNYQQIIRHRNTFDFEYYDEDGTLHWFYKTSDNEAKDEDGLGLTLSFQNGNFRMVDLFGNEKWFDYHGRLFKIVGKDKLGNETNIINIIYGNGNEPTNASLQISEINDNQGHAISFVYDNDHYLTSVSYKRADGITTATTSFLYAENHLCRITNDDLTYSQYEYDGLLNNISNERGYGIKLISDRTGVTNFGLTNISDYYEPPTAKVRSVWQGFEDDLVHVKDNVYCHGFTLSASAKAGEDYLPYSSISVFKSMVKANVDAFFESDYYNSLSIMKKIALMFCIPSIYLGYECINVAPYMETCEPYFSSNYRMKKSYDIFGRVVSSYIDDYSFASVDVNYYESGINKNKVKKEIDYSSNLTSYGLNMSFEDETINPHWSVVNAPSSYYSVQLSSQFAAHGKQSLELFASTSSSFSVEQYEPLVSESGKYTVLGCIRVENIMIPGIIGSDYGAYIYLKGSNGVVCGRSEYVNASLSPDVNGFINVSFLCELINPSGVTIGLGIKDCSGIVYFDKLQITYSPYGADNSFNNAVNGSFLHGGNGWSLWYGAGTVGHVTYVSNGNPTEQSYAIVDANGTGSVNLFQRIPLENNSQNTTYSVSVWLKRSGRLYSHGSSAYIALNYKLYDENWGDVTGFELKTIDLVFDTWYKVSNSFIAPPEAKYAEINIQLLNIEGAILVDHISLVRAKIEEYDYDDKGRNISYSNGSNNVYIVENGQDENGQEEIMVVNGINRYSTIKDNNNNILSSTDLFRNVKTDYTYDPKERVTSAVFSTLDNSYKIGTTTEYLLQNMEDVVTTTDSLGFKTISSSYAYSGLLKKTEFNDGTYVEYNYGTGGEFLSQPAVITINHRDNDNDETILTTTIYNYFTMDDLTNLLPGADPLCIHVGALKSVIMPNGAVYSYDYDKWGNVVEISRDGDSLINYTYDTNGLVIAKQTGYLGENNQNQKIYEYTETYFYDGLYRLVELKGEDSNNTTIRHYFYEYSANGGVIAKYDAGSNYCYKQISDTSGRAVFSMQGSYQEIRDNPNNLLCRVGSFKYLNEIQCGIEGNVQKNINIEVAPTTWRLLGSDSSISGALTRTRSGLTETIAVGGDTKITYTYNSANKDYGRVILEDNKLITNNNYPDGVRFVYTRDLDGNITAITVSKYGDSANGVTYNVPYKFLTDSYEYDNGYVNLWNYEWMQQNKPVNSYDVSVVPDTEYNGVTIKNIIRLHAGSFYANSQYQSLVDTAALKSGIKGDKITFWARMATIPSGSPTYVPCLVYSDGTLSPYQTILRNNDWQFFSITVNKNKTAVALRLPWYWGAWLEIGNMSIYVEKNAWDTQWALSNTFAGASALPQERVNDTDIVTDIIRIHQTTYYNGQYHSLVDPNLLANGGDCITLTYRARIDALDSNWLNNYSQDVLNTMVRALRFRYSDNGMDYGSKVNIDYNTNWQTFSIISAPGKKVVGIELGYNYPCWIRIGNVRITAQNLGCLDDRLTGQTLYNGNYIGYEYDQLGRESGLEIKAQKHSATNIIAENYSYYNGGTSNGQTKTSYTVTAKAITYGSNNNITYNYMYCMDNTTLNPVRSKRSNPYNIWQIKEGSDAKVVYTYDSLGRLIRETNYYIGATIIYTYDSNNNLTSKTIVGGTVKNYLYDSNKKDKLLSYNGHSLSYDASGNIVSYDGKTFSWQGRKLVSLVSNGVTKTYAYDINGIRSSKTVGNITMNYLYNGTTLLRETNGSDTIYYLYGQNGLIGLEINGIPYYYVRNLQGDVMKIIDGSGNVVVEYTYDSWGKVYSVTGTLASTVGAKNPIRYRGYYYDTETELYYLNSRYYDPELGRFISPDVGTEGGNLYAYCQNDPVNRSDPSGCFSWGGFVDKIVDTAVKTWEKMVDVYCAAVDAYCNVRVAVEKEIKKTVFYKIAEDIKNYDSNNTNLDAVYDAHYFSGFEGQFVMLIKGIGGSVSFGRIIVMETEWKDEDEFKDVLRHEHGHYEQYKELGFIRYLFGIALPSFSHAIKDDKGPYHSQLWEVTADILGGVSPSTTKYSPYSNSEWRHEPDAEEKGWMYYGRIKNGCIFNVIIDCFLLYM